jgi:hypothetical protein
MTDGHLKPHPNSTILTDVTRWRMVTSCRTHRGRGAEPPDDPVSKPGEFWVLGNHRVLCGDATVLADVERVLDGPLADMCFTGSLQFRLRDSPKDKLRARGGRS